LTFLDGRSLLEKTLYGSAFATRTAREIAVALAVADLGPGAHALGDGARSLSTISETLGSIRSNLIKKDILFVPSSGMVQFRMPLADRYVIAFRRGIAQPKSSGTFSR